MFVFFLCFVFHGRYIETSLMTVTGRNARLRLNFGVVVVMACLDFRAGFSKSNKRYMYSASSCRIHCSKHEWIDEKTRCTTFCIAVDICMR